MSPDVPAVAAHQRSTLCVWLPFDGDLSSTVTDDDSGDLCKEREGGTRSVAEEPSTIESNDLISCPLEKYQSLLRYFRSYRYMWMSFVRACLHGGGGLQIGEVSRGGSLHLLSCKRAQVKMRDYMDRRVTPPKQITSPTWGSHLHVNRL